MHMHYVLEGHRVVPAKGILEWGAFFEKIENRRVAQDTIGKFWISTVFIGIDHGIFEAPLVFETMVFGGDEEYVDRCSTWEEAEKMHAVAVEMVLDARFLAMQREARQMPMVLA